MAAECPPTVDSPQAAKESQQPCKHRPSEASTTDKPDEQSPANDARRSVASKQSGAEAGRVLTNARGSVSSKKSRPSYFSRPSGRSGKANTPAMTPITSEFNRAAGGRGRALSERLRGITGGNGFNENLMLCQVRGTTGTTQEGILKEQSDGLACCCGSQKGKYFFAVKGPWMLRFKKGDDSAVATGVPVPLDGATISAVGELEFELSNVHVKEDFYGKETLIRVHKDACKTFEHSVEKLFEAPSQEARDQWVQKLQAHIGMLKEGLARKMQNRSKEKPLPPRVMTTGTAAEVNRSAAMLFAEYEEEIEQEIFKIRTNVPAVAVMTAGGPY